MMVSGDIPAAGASPRAGRTGWTRVLIAAGVPAVIGVAVWLPLNDGAWDGPLNALGNHLGCQSSRMGCLGPAILGIAALAVAGCAATGALLRLAGVRPAWPVALAGPVIALLLGTAFQGSSLGRALSLPGLDLGLVLAISYGAAAYLTMPGGRAVWRITTGLSLLAVVLVLHVWLSPPGQSGGAIVPVPAGGSSVTQAPPASPQCPTAAPTSPPGSGASALPPGC
jgi:hypothetical protein